MDNDANEVLTRIPSELFNNISKDMSDFYARYSETVDQNREIVISEFESKHDDWSRIVPFMQRCDLYGDCLLLYVHAVNLLPTFDKVDKLTSFIAEFENYEYSPHNYLQVLYHNLGITWHQLSALYDNRAIEAFRKSIFYLLGLSSYTSYSPICYAFKRCSTYLYQALIKEQINISSPATFNDPFDSPVLALLNNTADDISKLIRTAYLSCVKIACFVCNVKQPFMIGGDPGEIVRDQQKQKNSVPEFLNELMWAHYADYHKGICIKYHFPNSLTEVHSKPASPVRYFRDVEYKDDLSILNVDDAITIKDAFFAKSKAWEYENELRFIQCDLNGKGDYDAINVPNCIEAVYFGVRCPQREIDAIKEILKDKEFRKITHAMIDGRVQEVINSQGVRFYKMEFDSNRFGSLVANPI